MLISLAKHTKVHNICKFYAQWATPFELRYSIPVVKGTISDRQFQTSLFSKPPDFFPYSERTSL